MLPSGGSSSSLTADHLAGVSVMRRKRGGACCCAVCGSAAVLWSAEEVALLGLQAAVAASVTACSLLALFATSLVTRELSAAARLWRADGPGMRAAAYVDQPEPDGQRNGNGSCSC